VIVVFREKTALAQKFDRMADALPPYPICRTEKQSV